MSSPPRSGALLHPAPRDSIDFTPWVDAAPFAIEFDYSYDGTMRSLEDSLQRMAIERIDIAFIHDCDVFTHGAEQQKIYFKEAMEGGYRALLKLREEGVVKAIGFGVNEWQVCHEALKRGDFDCFLLAGRYTLLEQESLDEFLPLCEARKAAVVIGGGLNSGILATGAVPGAKYNYAPAPDHIMDKVQEDRGGVRATTKCRCRRRPCSSCSPIRRSPRMCRAHAPSSRWSRISPGSATPIPTEFWQELEALEASARGCARRLLDDQDLAAVHGDGDRGHQDEAEDDLLGEDATRP